MRAVRGFTLVELLIVIAIIAILAAVLFPVFARAREKARGHTCTMNLANLALALRCYAHEHEGRYPPREDDLSPLMPDYLTTELAFCCPSAGGSSGMGEVPMGAPADEEAWRKGQVGPGAQEAPVVGEGVPMPEAGAPVPVPGAAPPDEQAPKPRRIIFTDYYYRAGRRHNQAPLAPLCADHRPRHNDGANVLFSDGAVKRLDESRWRELGFMTPDEIRSQRHPGLYDEQGYPMGGPPGGEPPP